MLKLLICIVCVGLLAAATAQLRQQERELAYQCNNLHDQIREIQIKLWNQQLQIAMATVPDAIEQTVGKYQLMLVPSNPTLAPVEDGSSDAE